MKIGKHIGLILGCLFLLCTTATADDSCVFSVTSNDVKPNVMIMLDNGPQVEHIAWHANYDDNVDYTPGGCDPSVPSPTCFTNERGYIYTTHAGTNYLVPIQADWNSGSAWDADDSWEATVAAGFTFNPAGGIGAVTLPDTPSTVVDADGVKDNADKFRFSANYLNWIFFSGFYAGDGSDLPAKTRFYYAKKAIFTVTKMSANKVYFGVQKFSSNGNGSVNSQPLQLNVDEPLQADPADNTLDADYVNGLNNMSTFPYAPLAEGVADAADYLRDHGNHTADTCRKYFVILVTPGLSIEDGQNGTNDTGRLPRYLTGDLDADVPSWDGDNAAAGIGEGNIKWGTDAGGYTTSAIPVGVNGTTDLDDVAYYLYTHDVGSEAGTSQILTTYTVGFMASALANRFLINTSNNGNGNLNLYDTNDPEYGKYHFSADSGDALATSLLEALNSILERTNAFAAPVVPITRTTSGDRLYMSFFTPRGGSNVWEGNVVKLGLNADNEIVDKNGDAATNPNGSLKDTMVPYWETIDWADPFADNYEVYSGRDIYTYLDDGTPTTDLTDPENAFVDTNGDIDATVLGNPTHALGEIINFVRGQDVFDADDDGVTAENREIITGDILHSEPLVYEFIHSEDTFTLTGYAQGDDDDDGVADTDFIDNEIITGSKGGRATVKGALYAGDTKLDYDALENAFTVGEVITGQTSKASATISAMTDNVTRVFYGSNDGMLHAVKDDDGTEAWAFIPPNQLSRLKDMVEGVGHQYFVDSSPKIYLKDVDGDGFLTDIDDDGIWESTDDQVILICGERKGSTSYFALDVTQPDSPKYLWRTSGDAGDAAGNAADPDTVVAELGESWSEPKFGKVKTTAEPVDGEWVFFIGAGYGINLTDGNAVLAIDPTDGTVVKTFKNDADGDALAGTNISGMDYSIPSNLDILDTDNNGFIDKLYVGDVGGQVWRFGRFTDAANAALGFPAFDENIDNWRAISVFYAGCNESDCTDGIDNNDNDLIDERRKFFYAPTVVLEKTYDLVYFGTGDRDNPCYREVNPDGTDNDDGIYDEVYAIKDDHTILPDAIAPVPTTMTHATIGIVDVTHGAAVSIDGSDKGWYVHGASGEKMLAEGTVFAGVYFFTTYTPNNDPCVPGGEAKLYALNYKTGAPVYDFDDDGVADDPYVSLGGGIPSKPVVVISDSGTTMFVSVGSTNPDPGSPSLGAGITNPVDPGDAFNFYERWWKEEVF